MNEMVHNLDWTTEGRDSLQAKRERGYGSAGRVVEVGPLA